MLFCLSYSLGLEEYIYNLYKAPPFKGRNRYLCSFLWSIPLMLSIGELVKYFFSLCSDFIPFLFSFVHLDAKC